MDQIFGEHGFTTWIHVFSMCTTLCLHMKNDCQSIIFYISSHLWYNYKDSMGMIRVTCFIWSLMYNGFLIKILKNYIYHIECQSSLILAFILLIWYSEVGQLPCLLKITHTCHSWLLILIAFPWFSNLHSAYKEMRGYQLAGHPCWVCGNRENNRWLLVVCLHKKIKKK